MKMHILQRPISLRFLRENPNFEVVELNIGSKNPGAEVIPANKIAKNSAGAIIRPKDPPH